MNDKTNAKDVPDSLKAKTDEYLNMITEAVAETSDELLDKFFSGEPLTEAELIQGVRAGVRSGEIRPVYCGSATQQIGVERLLDLIGEYFPSYGEKGLVEAKNLKGETVKLHTDESESFSALVL